MTKISKLAQKFSGFGKVLDKIDREVTGLKADYEHLKASLADQVIPPAAQAALDSMEAKLRSIDAIIPDEEGLQENRVSQNYPGIIVNQPSKQPEETAVEEEGIKNEDIRDDERVTVLPPPDEQKEDSVIKGSDPVKEDDPDIGEKQE